LTETHTPERNWAGNYTYRAEKLHRPTTIEQVQEIVANAASVHVLGSRHSFNDIADSSELLSLENLPADVVVDHETQTVSFGGGMKYGNLVKTLNDEGVDSVSIHFTWKREPDAVQEMVAQIEHALTPFEARPHWGKVFHADAATIAPLYKRHSDFVRLVERLDPRGAFRNAWLKARVLGDR